MSGLCRRSRAEEVLRLKELWKRCFGDEDAYIDHYFNVYYRPERAMVLEAEGQAVSMLLTFPFELTDQTGENCRACYIYAFCTDPHQQGKGCGRRLLGWTEEQAAAEGCAATVMVPGEASLFDFYAGLGYEVGFTLREMEVTSACGGEVRPCSAERYQQLREQRLAGCPHVSYPREVLAYQLSLCRDSGGGFYEWKGGLAAAEPEGKVLTVKELLSDEPEAMAAALLNQLGGERAVVRLPAGEGENGRRFGVIRWLNGRKAWRNGWLAFGFD